MTCIDAQGDQLVEEIHQGRCHKHLHALMSLWIIFPVQQHTNMILHCQMEKYFLSGRDSPSAVLVGVTVICGFSPHPLTLVLRTLRSACVLRRRQDKQSSLIAVDDQSCWVVSVDNEGYLHSKVGVNLFIPHGMTCYLPT
jgi:hypothetical protein